MTQFVQGSAPGEGEQIACRGGRTGAKLCPGRSEGTCRFAPRLWAQYGCMGEERRSCGGAAPCECPLGRCLQLSGDRLVGAHRCPRQMPCAAVGVNDGIGYFRKDTVGLPQVREPGRPVDSGAQERMPKAHQSGDVEQSRLHCGIGRAGIDVQLLRCAPQQVHVADRLGGGGQQQSLCRRRQCADPLHITPLDAAGHRSGGRPPEPVGWFRLATAVGEFQQRQGVAARFGEDAVADALVCRTSSRRIQQCLGIDVVQAAEC